MTQALVNAKWLADHLNEVILLDASVTRIDRGTGVTEFAPGPEGYLQSHLPGAQFADLMGGFSDQNSPFNFTAPPLAQFEGAARALGINQNSHVVIYDSLGGAYAARLRYMLRGAGLQRVSVLDGGLQAWVKAGYGLESGPVTKPSLGDFVADPIEDLFVGQAEVQSLSAVALTQVPLICALREVQYDAGHIPNSLNLPYPAILDSDGLIDTDKLRAALTDLGLGDDITPILYCGGGINAAGLALGLELLGIDDVAIYDDSMAGWRAAKLPIETSEK